MAKYLVKKYSAKGRKVFESDLLSASGLKNYEKGKKYKDGERLKIWKIVEGKRTYKGVCRDDVFSVRGAVEQGIGSDFQYYVDLNYNETTNCEDYGCNEEGICRCGRIESVKCNGIRDIEYLCCEISKNIIAKLKNMELNISSEMIQYGVDRILHHANWENPNIVTGSGYYGDEVYGVQFDLYREKDVLVEFIKSKNNLEAVKRLLIFEYGNILPVLETYNKVTIREVFIDEIKTPNMEYYTKRLDNKKVEEYVLRKDKLPIGIYRKHADGYYLLVDGYHRLEAAKRQKAKKVRILVFA